MNRNYNSCKTAVMRIENGHPPQKEYDTLISKLDEHFEKAKGCVYTALPFNALNITACYSLKNEYSNIAYVATITFGICTLKWIADLTDRSKIKQNFLDKYGL